MKLLKRILLISISFLVVLALGITLFLRHSLAPMDGELKLEGLSQKVTVLRDHYGIPHVKAENKLDALKAVGFVMASERLFQMELSRRLTQGRLSEVFGSAAVPTDKLYRSLMLKKTAERMLEHLKKENKFDQQTWKEMEAYYDGINQYIRTQPLPYEFAITGIKPEEFKPIDAYVMTGHMAYLFGVALKLDPLMTSLAGKLSEEQLQELRTDKIPMTLRNAKLGNPKTTAAILDLFNLPAFEGSNSWLIAPSRSTSGKSLFANDPHIGFSNPSIWVEAHIQTPEFELYGHYLPMVPFAVLGHSRHHVWGFTMSVIDDTDLYKETLDLDKKTVIFNGKPQPYNEWQETIKVKNEPDVVINMIETPHGPLLDNALEEKGLSLKWAFHSNTNDVMTTLREMGEAKDMKSFENSLKRITAPGLNVMYADPANIAWWVVGDIAVKKNPNSDFIFDGASGKDEYASLLPWEKHPQSVNPASGYIVTANSRPASLSATIRGDWQPDDRFETIDGILKEKQMWSAEDFKIVQTQNYNHNSGPIRDILLKNLKLTPEEQEKYKSQLEILQTWSAHSEVNSRGAALFHLWNGYNVSKVLASLSPNEQEVYGPTPAPWTFYKRIIFNENSPWWKNKSLSDVVTEGFRTMMTDYPKTPTWGDIHTIEFMHPLGRMKPLNKIFNIGPYPAPGAFNEINNNKYWAFGGTDFKITAGASARRIVDMAHPEKSWGVNPIGISGHLLSPFRKDQVKLFLEGKYRAQIMDEQDLQTAKTHELILRP